MSETELLKPQNLKMPKWRTTYILKSDYLGLLQSIKMFGFLQPVIAMEDGTIIDGHARWAAAHDLSLESIPVKRLQCTQSEAMLLHVQINRCRGSVVPYRFGRLIRTLLKVFDEQEIINALNMTEDEFDIYEDGSLIKKRKVKQHDYNKAWVPIESKSGEDFFIERPPTPDK
jgi:ParB-like chromosome segregation protein Spo0J